MSLSAMDIAGGALLGLVVAYSILAAVRTDLPWPRWRVAILAACRVSALAGVGAWFFDVRLARQTETDRVELVVLADRSASVSPAGRQAIEDWVRHARGAAAAIDFGTGKGDTSDLAEALEAARAAFRGRGEKRVLVLSDGRSTAGEPLEAALTLRREGIKVYAVPLEALDGESLIADLAAPPAAWRSVPVPIQVSLRANSAGPCRLTLLVDGEKKDEREAKLRQGLSTAEMKAVFETDGVHHVEVRAEFARDTLSWNNAASALVDVPLAPRIVILSDVAPSLHPLGAALSAGGFEARVLPPTELSTSISCDCVVLDNVPARALGDARMRAIEEFVRQGGAVVFTGGPGAYGAGGYRGTPLEPVFPVLLEPKKEYPPFALAVVLDNSWSMNEGLSSKVGKIDLAKEIAIAAIEGLNKGDWLTLVSFDSDYHNIIPPTKVQDLEPAKYEVSRIGAFGMTNILGGLEEAARILKPLDAAYKHVVLISDGKETEVGTDYSHLLSALERMQVTLSTIGVGLSTNAKLLNTLAYAGKGRYRHVGSLVEIPAVVLQEAKSVDSQLVADTPLPPKQVEDDPALVGIDVAALPRLAAYSRSRARVHAWTPLVISRKEEPLLARMRYGRGQSVAFLSSASSPWAREWIEKKPAEYVAFWRQLVTSAIGPPHHALEPAVSYLHGWPVFDFGELRQSNAVVGRVAEGKVAQAPLAGPVRAEGAAAILVTAHGRSNRACSWSRCYGKEFADPAAGITTLRELCRATRGLFDPRPDELFAKGHATVRSELDPTVWLAGAVILLIAELLLRRGPALARFLRRGAVVALTLLVAPQAQAMEVSREGSKLIVTGTNFRYTWDTRRGGELAEVEQPGLASGGWWMRGMPGRRPSSWQRVNSTFAWKSLDTIPALSFSTKRMAYYSGEWNIACANADRNATLNVLKQSPDEVVFETESNPKILENRRLPVPWKVKQRVRVLDSGVVITRLEARLSEGEVYELDWAMVSVNLDDSLYKEPSPEKQARFVYGWAFPGEGTHQFNSYKPVIQKFRRLPLDIDLKPQDTIAVGKPLLYGCAGYDLSHVKDSAANGYAECCLEEARSLVGTKADFGSHLMIRPQSGMSPVPTYAGSMRGRPSFGLTWNLFDGETRGLNEPLAYANTLTLAFGSRKRSSRPDAPADDRNLLLGARIYYARDRLPSPDEAKAMAAEGCDTLLLGPAWRENAGAVIAAAHAAGLRVGATVDVKELGNLVRDGDWFARQFQKDRDGLFVTGASFLNAAIPEGEFEALGEKVAFKHDGPFRANAASFAVCMRTLRRIVGARGFLIGDPSPCDPTLLSLAEFDLHASANLNPYLWGSAQERDFRRHRAGAGFAPISDSLSPQLMALAAMHGDTPIVLWPSKDKSHLAWWELCRRLPAQSATVGSPTVATAGLASRGTSRIESDLIAAERRFTTTSPSVHGTLFDAGDGRGVLLLAAEKADSAKVAFTGPGFTTKGLDAGAFSQWQVKLFEVAAPKEDKR